VVEVIAAAVGCPTGGPESHYPGGTPARRPPVLPTDRRYDRTELREWYNSALLIGFLSGVITGAFLVLLLAVQLMPHR
jgi:hypothetical protein